MPHEQPTKELFMPTKAKPTTPATTPAQARIFAASCILRQAMRSKDTGHRAYLIETAMEFAAEALQLTREEDNK